MSALVLEATCPHCHLENAAFDLLAEKPHSPTTPAPPKFTVVFSCRRCFGAVGLTVTMTARTSTIVQGQGDFHVHASRFGRVGAIYPCAPEATEPEHISESVSRCYKQAIDNRNRANVDAAGVMFRKCLDLATKELDVELAGKALAQRIDVLHREGKLTDALKDWAHSVRLDGNDAAHEPDELSKPELAQLAAFTEVFLQYAFTLPAQVTARKSDRIAKGA